MASSIARAVLRRPGLLARSAAATKPNAALVRLHRPGAAVSVLDMHGVRPRASILFQSNQALLLRGLSTVLKPSDVPSATRDDERSAATTAAAAEEELRHGMRSAVHFKLSPNRHPLNLPKLDPAEKVWENPIHHSVWTKEEVEGVRITHLPAEDWTSKAAYGIAQTLRFSFDLLAGFKTRRATEAMYLNRVVFLETVAGIPGMVAGMIRHMHSLRRMKRDHGWIHTLLEGGQHCTVSSKVAWLMTGLSVPCAFLIAAMYLHRMSVRKSVSTLDKSTPID